MSIQGVYRGGDNNNLKKTLLFTSQMFRISPCHQLPPLTYLIWH